MYRVGRSQLEPITFVQFNLHQIYELDLRFDSVFFDNWLLDLPAITSINLDCTCIKGFDPTTFQSSIHLEELILTHNSVKELQPDLFANCKNLIKFNFNDNRIELKSDTFKHMRNLKYLNLKRNRISDIPDGVFSNLTNLRFLQLMRNKISVIQEGAFFPYLLNLRVLDLSKNKIKLIDKDYCFRSLVNLVKLNLQHNQISNLPANLFMNLVNLEELNLSEN